MNRVIAQLRREYWENPGHLLKVPFWLAVFIILFSVMSTYSLFQHADISMDMNVDIDLPWKKEVATNNSADGPNILEKLAHVQYIIYLIFTVVALINMFSYSLAALLTDRQDRSVLFFKSMPVSEWVVVTAKLFIAVLAIPLMYWLAAFITTLVFSTLTVVLGTTSLSLDAFSLWSAMDAVAVGATSFVYLLLAALWGLPLFSVLLLFSAWSKKHPLGNLLLLLLVVWFIENLLLGQSIVLSGLGDYLSGFAIDGLEGSSEPQRFSAAIGELFTRPGLYVGWMVAAGALWMAVFLRNRRFEI
ncbi:hypothetical protein [Gilvimarinus chinensis]|uniref:hypothetical protein n=1 Tax=Gilvimarinus chinensis TaxID=396005 RepID=UPI00037FBCC5|nr:hypothetical protein [Gilvimarinus chinensis]